MSCTENVIYTRRSYLVIKMGNLAKTRNLFILSIYFKDSNCYILSIAALLCWISSRHVFWLRSVYIKDKLICLLVLYIERCFKFLYEALKLLRLCSVLSMPWRLFISKRQFITSLAGLLEHLVCPLGLDT